MKISVIIVAYKSGDILVKCLDSIAMILKMSWK